MFYSFVEGKEGYPDKIELLSKPSPLMEIKEGDHIEFIQLTDDYSHLSAIIMDEQYYNYLMDHYEIHNGIRYASIDSLICLKALAYLNLLNEKEAGRQVNDEDLSKHRRDVFMAVASLEVDASFEVPYNIRRMLDDFLSSITDKRIIQSLSDSLGLNQEQVLSLKQVLNNCFVSLE